MAKKIFVHSKWAKRIAGALVLVIVFVAGAWIASPKSSYDYEMLSYDLNTAMRSVNQEAAYDYDDGASYDYYYEGELSAVPDESVQETRIIKTGSLTINVKSTEEAMTSIATIAEAYDGFVQSSYTWLQSDETTAGSVTLRVDSANFEVAVEDIKALATVIQSESISGEDVTSEYVDLQARLANYESLEDQYLEILEQAYTVEDMLSVSDYLYDVRENIETIQGQLDYMEDRTDYSTITVSVYEEASIVAPTSDWQPWVEIKTAFNRLIVTAQGLVNVVIWLVIFGVPALIVIWVVRKIWKRMHRNRK